MNRAEAVRLAQQHAQAKPETYVGVGFKPHPWVIFAILEAADTSEAQLVEFMRSPEAATLAQEGDDSHRTPTLQAIHSMRELLKIRAGVERTRRRGKTQPAVLEECDGGHKYYREGHTTTKCPYCLAMQLDKARSTLDRMREAHAAIAAELRRA